ncbi:MAG: hypothetical protein ABR538_10155 [Candidatus Binatia bacterium]
MNRAFPPTRPGLSVVTAFLASSMLATCLAASPAAAVTITVHSTDGSGEGFNDTTPRSPVGGNPGKTLGAQRFFLFQYAANAWGLRLDGDLPVIVSASFSALGGTANSATLGFAAPTTVHRDFKHAPASQTWYVAAVANQISGTDWNDLAPGACPVPLANNKCPDLFAQFNSDVDNQTVLGSVDFYYGVDGNSGTDLDFLSVVLHEMGHGLGVLDLIDPSTGRISPDPANDNCLTCSDAYTRRLENSRISPKQLSNMTNQQRLMAIVDDGDLVWTGPAAKSVSDFQTAGVRNDGALQVYAPVVYEPGSSVAHLDTDLSPNELMEPFLSNPPPRELALSKAVLEDVGWETFEVPRCGDPNHDNKITTTDALLMLHVAVGNVACEEYACNVNFSGGNTTADALIVLRRAVGQGLQLRCPLF